MKGLTFCCSGGGPRPPRFSGPVRAVEPSPFRPLPPLSPSLTIKPPRFCGRKAKCLLTVQRRVVSEEVLAVTEIPGDGGKREARNTLSHPECAVMRAIPEWAVMRAVPEWAVMRAVPEWAVMRAIPEWAVMRAVPEWAVMRAVPEWAVMRAVPEWAVMRAVSMLQCRGAGWEVREAGWKHE